ncbi:hypothetical protein SCD_n00958 [Calderihabitans maritimus]|uniref:Uncharacterized protein n=2 Tax=Calderihabitans maritimus TaxID=1246530 RepID=A0A1Z5HNU0_9FIRM|nr:hypothetical protein SCD_n00958 [Calderihabitans maritimus]
MLSLVPPGASPDSVTLDKTLQHLLYWLSKHYDEMDHEAQKYADKVFESLIDLAEINVENLPDSPQRRRSRRLYSLARGEHFNVRELLRALEVSPSGEHEAWKEAYEFIQIYLQRVLDLLFDLTRAERHEPVDVSILGLLFGCIDEILAATHLARHNYYTQANAHIRTVLEVLDKVELFHNCPEWIEVWAGDDVKKILKELSPSAVREKLGREKFDPIYDFLSDHGTHATFRWLQARAVQRVNLQEPNRKTAVLWVGGSKLEHHLIWTSCFLIYTVTQVLLLVSRIGEEILHPEECMTYITGALDSFIKFTEKYMVPWAADSGLNPDELRRFLLEVRENTGK